MTLQNHKFEGKNQTLEEIGGSKMLPKKLSKIWHHFRNQSDLKADVIKKCHVPKFYIFQCERNEKDSDDL